MKRTVISIRKQIIRLFFWGQFSDEPGNEEQIDGYHHITRSAHDSIDKARRLLDDQPQYSTLETLEEAMKS